MGALLSQAVANQLRQFPGSQDPRPSPPQLIQQVLNPPGPSLPTWMAPVMENQQVLATSMDPAISGAQRMAANQALQRQMLEVALATGPGITKEQREAWEAENEAYRAKGYKGTGGGPSIPAGTRVSIRPEGARQDPHRWYPTPETPGRAANIEHVPSAEGVIVEPGTPQAGKFGHLNYKTDKVKLSPTVSPGKDYVAVRGEGSQYWFWRHRDSLEMLPPLDFKIGDKVIVNKDWGDFAGHGEVATAPRDAIPSPGPGWVWVDVEKHRLREIGRPSEGDYSDMKGVKHYAGGNWGAWVLAKDLLTKKK